MKPELKCPYCGATIDATEFGVALFVDHKQGLKKSIAETLHGICPNKCKGEINNGERAG